MHHLEDAVADLLVEHELGVRGDGFEHGQFSR
jgi:hypothetical protein